MQLFSYYYLREARMDLCNCNGDGTTRNDALHSLNVRMKISLRISTMFVSLMGKQTESNRVNITMYTLHELCILENIFKSLNMVLSEQIHLI